MFCEKCGKENAEGVNFCAGCGAPVGAAKAPQEAAQGAPSVGGGYTKWIAAGAAVIVLVLLLAIFGAFKPGSVRVVERFIESGIKAKASVLYKTMDVPYTRDFDMDKEDIRDHIEMMQEGLVESREDRKEEGIKISVKSIKRTKAYKKREVRIVEEYLEDFYGYDVDEYPLDALACVQVKTVTKEDGEKETDKMDYIAAKVDGKWYVMQYLSKTEIKNVIRDAE